VEPKYLYFTALLFRPPWRFRAISSFEKRTIEVEGISTGYLTGGAEGVGLPLILLHGVAQVRVSGPGVGAYKEQESDIKQLEWDREPYWRPMLGSSQLS